jgi:hypothetical protein
VSDDHAISGALHELREQIGKEHDPSNLRDLVLEINRLLDMIEGQLAVIERRRA